MNSGRSEELKLYQRQRAALRRSRGIVSRTVWILAADEDRFRDQISALVDHARLIEGVTGGPVLSAIEIAEIIKRHSLPYDPLDLIFLSRAREAVVLNPVEKDTVEQRIQEIVEKYQLPVSVSELLGGVY